MMSDPIGYDFGGTDEGSHYDYSNRIPMKEGSLASRENAGYDNRSGEDIQKDSVNRLARASQAAIGNGKQAGFATGATRSTDAGKVDFEGHFNPEVLAIFGDYMNRHKVQRDGRLRASDNWQEGIPVFRYVKSLIRHTFEFWRMWRGTTVTNPDSGSYFTFRDVLCAMMFNTMGIIYELARKGGTWNIENWLDRTHLSTQDRKMFETEGQPVKDINGFRAGSANPIPYENPAAAPGGCAYRYCDTAGQDTREEQ
jgi:hypothetical protein